MPGAKARRAGRCRRPIKRARSEDPVTRQLAGSSGYPAIGTRPKGRGGESEIKRDGWGVRDREMVARDGLMRDRETERWERR
jgi:hypothetical protein